MDIKFTPVDPGKKFFLPEYKTSGSAGMDIASCNDESILITTGEYKVVPTNLILELPEGYEAQIRPRSGLALNNGVTVLNSPGTIDSDYRGEIKIILINHGDRDFVVHHGDRIAQMVIAKVERVRLVESDELSETERGTGGYGSTGLK